MARFTLPRDIYYGPYALNELNTLQGHKKAIIITGGSSMQQGGFLDKTESILKEIGIESKCFAGVEPDPSIETVMKGAKEMQDFQPDVIVALGGGSPIDAAKAMWVFYEHPELRFDDIKKPFTIPPLRNKAIFVAIPSTSGTATEVTAFSVITDYSTNIKYPLADFEITPDIAILDTSIPQTMSKELVAHTGLDALTHAMEAYVAKGRSDFSEPLAMKAIIEIFANLLGSYEGEKQARESMHIAQCLAGMAFTNALLGIAHSIAHKTGAVFGISHGCCNAILLPRVIEYNACVSSELYARIARNLNLLGNDDRELTASLVEAIEKLNEKLGIPCCYQAAGVSEELWNRNVDEIAKNAIDDPCTLSNPRPIDVEQMRKLLVSAYKGVPVDF